MEAPHPSKHNKPNSTISLMSTAHPFLLQLPPTHPASPIHIRVRPSVPAGPSGSIMAQEGDGTLLECVQCWQQVSQRYTEDNWLARYANLYALEDENETQTLLAQNSDPNHFVYDCQKLFGVAKIPVNFSIWPAQSALATNHHARSKLTVSHSAWDPDTRTLELQVVCQIPSTKIDIECVEYTNMLLLFDTVDFSCEEKPVKETATNSAGAPFKRQSNGSDAPRRPTHCTASKSNKKQKAKP